jgi:hypothetical protein
VTWSRRWSTQIRQISPLSAPCTTALNNASQCINTIILSLPWNYHSALSISSLTIPFHCTLLSSRTMTPIKIAVVGLGRMVSRMMFLKLTCTTDSNTGQAPCSHSTVQGSACPSRCRLQFNTRGGSMGERQQRIQGVRHSCVRKVRRYA